MIEMKLFCTKFEVLFPKMVRHIAHLRIKVFIHVMGLMFGLNVLDRCKIMSCVDIGFYIIINPVFKLGQYSTIRL